MLELTKITILVCVSAFRVTTVIQGHGEPLLLVRLSSIFCRSKGFCKYQKSAELLPPPMQMITLLAHTLFLFFGLMHRIRRPDKKRNVGRWLLWLVACTRVYLVILSAALNLIDLAGSERCGSNGSTGMRFTEGTKINNSLTVLSTVITALSKKVRECVLWSSLHLHWVICKAHDYLYLQDSHVPFRSSKLTLLLSDCLGGNSKTLMIVNINPSPTAAPESINTLRFATTVNQCNIGTAQKVVKFWMQSVVTDSPQMPISHFTRSSVKFLWHLIFMMWDWGYLFLFCYPSSSR